MKSYFKNTVTKIMVLAFMIVLFASCGSNYKKIDRCHVYTQNENVIVDGFNYSMGIGDPFNVDINVDFSELDHYVYNYCTSSKLPYIYVVLRLRGADEHKDITIGKIDNRNISSYQDFGSWSLFYNTEKMFLKDYDEYKRLHSYDLTDYCAVMYERYMPKSIR